MRRLLILAVLGSALLVPTTASAHTQLHRGCTNNLYSKYYVGAGHVSCDFAKRWAGRQIRGYRGPSSWRCEYSSAYRNGGRWGRCTSQGRVFEWNPRGV